MAEPYLSEIRIFPYGFAPRGWARCDGQTMSIMQNQALYALIGTRYGGNGQTTFNLPDLRGRVPMHRGTDHPLGAKAGEAAHTLTMQEVPGAHTHPVVVSSAAPDQTSPAGNVLGAGTFFVDGDTEHQTTPLARGMVQANEGGQPHENRQPYLTVPFCIALQGLFPSRP